VSGVQVTIVEIFALFGVIAVIALALLLAGIWVNWPRDRSE
jgi:uncharacterized iron-regulated membrane protein